MSVDPREILGVGPDADADEITAAYRRLAKRWHPDRANAPLSADQMTLLNVAYAALREAANGGPPPGAPEHPPPTPADRSAPVGVHPAASGAERADGSREHARLRALGDELRAALGPGEQVDLVTDASTWASPQTVLAVTDRRLLWLLDDVPVHRVRWLELDAIDRVSVRPPRPWRRRAILVCTDRRRRQWSFGELPAETAAAIVRRIRSPRQPTYGRPAG